MPHTHPERLATISASKVEEHFRDLYPIVALVSATRLLQFIEREGLTLLEHRALCANIIRNALPSIEKGPGHDPDNLPSLDADSKVATKASAAQQASTGLADTHQTLSAGVIMPATVHEKHEGAAS